MQADTTAPAQNRSLFVQLKLDLTPCQPHARKKSSSKLAVFLDLVRYSKWGSVIQIFGFILPGVLSESSSTNA